MDIVYCLTVVIAFSSQRLIVLTQEVPEIIKFGCTAVSSNHDFFSHGHHASPAQISSFTSMPRDPDSPSVTICEARDATGTVAGYVQLEILFIGHKPAKEMNIETYENILQRTENLTLDCSYDARSVRLPRKHPKHQVNYYCINGSISIHLNFVNHDETPELQGLLGHDVAGRVLAYHGPVGTQCIFENKITVGRYMIDGETINCLQCRPNTYWNEDDEVCSPCPPGTTRTKPHVFTTCIYDENAQRPLPSVTPPPSTLHTPKSSTMKTTTTSEIHSTLEPRTKDHGNMQSSSNPEEVSVRNINSSYALLRWCRISCSSGCENSFVQISVYECGKGYDSARIFTASIDSTEFALTSLNSNTIYCAIILQHQSFGDERMHKPVIFHTLRKLQPPANVTAKLKEGVVEITWSRPSHLRDLSIMVTYSNEDNTIVGNISISPPDDAKIRFLLPDLQRYKLSIHYLDNQRHGPKSVVAIADIKESGVEDRCTCAGCSLPWALFAVSVLILLIFLACPCIRNGSCLNRYVSAIRSKVTLCLNSITGALPWIRVSTTESLAQNKESSTNLTVQCNDTTSACDA